eukprot:362183-Chlamydomonas_euryale.AAC.1
MRLLNGSAACSRADGTGWHDRQATRCYAQHRHTLRGSAPCNSDSDLWTSDALHFGHVTARHWTHTPRLQLRLKLRGSC